MDTTKTIAALFDFDGVVMDTESQYSVFWNQIGKEYLPQYEGFGRIIKGQTLDQIYAKYLAGLEAEQAGITERLNRFEREMTFEYIPGVEDFLRILHEQGVKIAIVTSSNEQKMANVYAAHPELKERVDRILTAEMFARSKPAPDCYLHAARFFGFDAKDCFVFEDSLNGLRAGHASGATVVALTTGLSADTVRPFSRHAMPDFTEANRIGAEAFFQQLKD